MPANTKLTLSLLSSLTATGDLSAAESLIRYEKVLTLLSGVGAGQADIVWSDNRTIAASGTDSLDLAGGGLTSALGTALTFARLKGILVVAAAANVNNVVLTRPAANGVPWAAAASDAIPIRPGGSILWTAPDAVAVPVAAGTGDLLDLVNSGAGTPVVYDIVLLGTTA